MEVKIEIDESQFKDIVDQGLGALSPDEIKSIMREGILRALVNDDKFKSLLIDKKRWSYGSDNYDIVASKILEDAAKTIDFNPAFEEFKNKCIDFLKENYSSILMKLVSDTFVRGLGYYTMDSPGFRDDLRYTVDKYMHEISQNRY